jgi:hypothetical protein
VDEHRLWTGLCWSVSVLCAGGLVHGIDLCIHVHVNYVSLGAPHGVYVGSTVYVKCWSVSMGQSVLCAGGWLHDIDLCVHVHVHYVCLGAPHGLRDATLQCQH